MNIKTPFYLVIAILLNACTPAKKEESTTNWTVESIGGKTRMELFIKDGSLFYTASLYKKGEFVQVIQPSSLGLELKGTSFNTSLTYLSQEEETTIEEEYESVTGKASKIQINAKEKKVSFQNKDGKAIQIVMQAHDDGVAFRYVFPDAQEEIVVTDEHTTFNVGEGKAWMMPRGEMGEWWSSGYEIKFSYEIPTDSMPADSTGWSFPALFKLKNTWALISEASAEGDHGFYAAHLGNESPNGHYTVELPNIEEALGKYSNHAVLKDGNNSSSWRVIILGNLNTVVSSSLIKSVSPANKIEDDSWIKPGRSSWSWLSDHDSPQNFESMKRFVDFSVEMGWEYMLIDANWDLIKGGTVKELIDYSNAKGVGAMLWYNSGGEHNTVTERPRDIMCDPVKRKEEFAKIREWGVKGVKIDFFQSDKPTVLNLYEEILADAAKEQILVNFHGCTIPRGWSRTYPNLMTMEAVLGGECYTFRKEFLAEAPPHNTLMPFTRNAIGPLDYTPVIFGSYEAGQHLTTYAHELALSVVFESGLLHFGDAIGPYQNLPEQPKEFLKNVPVAWDRTKYLSGYPGKDIVIARKKKDTWYIAGINGEAEAKEIEVDLSSFFKDKDILVNVIKDGEDDSSFAYDEVTERSVKVNTLPYGGFTITVTKK